MNYLLKNHYLKQWAINLKKRVSKCNKFITIFCQGESTQNLSHNCRSYGDNIARQKGHFLHGCFIDRPVIPKIKERGTWFS